jgi:photosystem II stability/assembly factor-like uncharacterized protein
LALALSPILVSRSRAAEPRYFNDAALHAIQFVDGQEGWAVGDEGCVWHTIDGGRNWERQPTGVRASLCSVHFLNPYTGWVAGREELPHGAGSAGVLLFTQDGGLRWQRAGLHVLPGLNQVRFLDNETGFVAGDGTDQYPSGLYATADNGRTWKPVPGPRSPGWLAAGFEDKQNGVLGGAWSRLATLRQGLVGKADVDILGGRALRGLRANGNRSVVVGQGALVLTNEKAMGGAWRYVNLNLPREIQAVWDFHAVHGFGSHLWVVGRPGSVVLHSSDDGTTWEVLITGQPLPLNGVFFADEHRGWAVGEFGSILATADGGKTWTVQRRGGQRAAVLFLHAGSGAVPLDSVAWLGGQEGYLAAAMQVNAADPVSAAPRQGSEPQRFAAALRRAGGAAGEVLWQFPLAQHLGRSDQRDLIQTWDRLHGDRAAEQLLRQLVFTLRTWRPDVVVTDRPGTDGGASPAEALVAEAVREAFVRAADARAFPEQLQTLGLEPWKVSKLYGCCDGRAGSQVVVDATEAADRLQASARDFATPAAALLADEPLALPAQRFYKLLDSRLAGAANHHDLMQGIPLAPGGTARRDLGPPVETPREVIKAVQARRNLQALAETPADRLADPNMLLATIGPALTSMPDDHAASAAFALGSQFARAGQWALAREVFLLMGERYPAHPLTADAYRWLVRFQSSSEARRRQELKHFLVVSQTEFRASQVMIPAAGLGQEPARQEGSEAVQQATLGMISRPRETRQANENALAVGERLAAFGPLFATDPALQFCLQAARRNLGDFETARQWYVRFRDNHADGPWRDAAVAELWLANRVGQSPKPVVPCRFSASRPTLDGLFDEPCWEDLKPVALRDAVGETAKEYPTEVRLAYDRDFLYLALRCRHPAGRAVAPVKVRTRDADLRPFDRVSLLLDLDRDYATYFHLQVDQRGCVCEDCWGDRGWNPRWFVAVHSEPTCWQIEAAIPLLELTGDPVTVGRAWACNLVRVVPGRGVQACSLPADVEPRPEGMGLLLFTQDQPRPVEKQPLLSPVPGPKAP